MRTFLSHEKNHEDINPKFFRKPTQKGQDNYLLLLILLFLLLELKE